MAQTLTNTIASPSIEDDQPVQNGRRQIPALVGLMAVPLIVVTWHHARDFWLPMRNLFEEHVHFKHLITLFFVLSGFIAAYAYRSGDLKETALYCVERIARLWPMHVICLISLLFILPDVFVIRGEWMPIFITNLFMAHSWIPSSKWFWSYNAPSYATATLLCLELSLPLIIICLRKSTIAVLLTAALSVVALVLLGNAAHFPMDDPANVSLRGLLYINPLARLLEFSTGVTAAILFANNAHRMKLSRAKATALELCALALFVFVNLNSKEWQAASIPYIGNAGSFWLHNSGDAFIPLALFVFAIALERGVLSHFFAAKPMVFLGQIGLSFYMLHAVYIAFFNVRFYEEPKLLPAIFFFSSLLVAGHVLQTLLFTPIYQTTVQTVSKHLGRTPTADAFAQPLLAVRSVRGMALILVEILAAAILFYFALPTIDAETNKIPGPQEAGSSAGAPVSPFVTPDVEHFSAVDFAPWIRCIGATAAKRGSDIYVDTIWEADKKQSINYFVTVNIRDVNRNTIASARLAMDGRYTNVANGTRWSKKVILHAPSDSAAMFALVSVTRGLRKPILPQLCEPPSSPVLALPAKEQPHERKVDYMSVPIQELR